MIRMLYCSRAAPRISDDQIHDILMVSRRNNKALGLTGVLVHGGGMFMQVLEGPEDAVLRTYVKILDDPRHAASQVIHITPTNEQIFQGWSMGVIKSEPVEFQHIAELRARRCETSNAKECTDVMRAFAQMLEKK